MVLISVRFLSRRGRLFVRLRCQLWQVRKEIHEVLAAEEDPTAYVPVGLDRQYMYLSHREEELLSHIAYLQRSYACPG